MPILGLSVKPANLYVYVPLLEEKHVTEYSIMAFDVRKFDKLLQAADVTFGFIRRFISGEPQALTDTPEESYERRLTAVEREISTLGVLVSKLTADSTTASNSPGCLNNVLPRFTLGRGGSSGKSAFERLSRRRNTDPLWCLSGKNKYG